MSAKNKAVRPKIDRDPHNTSIKMCINTRLSANSSMYLQKLCYIPHSYYDVALMGNRIRCHRMTSNNLERL